MDDFSVELAAERISDSRSREYFKEVLSSFVGEGYRSAVVMLWSVVIADIVYKLQDLRDLYGDAAAKDILDLIEAKQKANPNGSEWESQLVDEVKIRMSLLEPADHQHLLQLQKIRHLSAHPVIGATNLLFSPNKETVRAAIRNALEGVLLKPPIFSRKIVSEFAADLAAKKTLLPDRPSLSAYLEAKYFKGLHPQVEREILKALWKFAFRLENVETNKNRDINVRILHLLIGRKPLELKAFMESQQAFFSEITNGPPLDELIHFLGSHPTLYSALSESARVIIENRAKESIDLFAFATFLSPNFPAHVEAVLAHPSRKDISAQVYLDFMGAARSAGSGGRLCILGAEIYGASFNYNTADARFVSYVAPLLQDYDSASLEYLLTQIEANSQVHGRGRASIDHPQVRDRCMTVLGAAFNISKYPHFKDNVS